MKTIVRKYRMLWLICLLFAGIPATYSNGQTGGGEKIESLKIAFITERLNLTTQEAQVFWPVYNSYRNDLGTLRKNFGVEKGSTLPADQQLDFEQKKLDLKKRYKLQFEATIGKDKTNTLYNLEEEFRQKLKELQQQRQQQRGNTGGRRW